MGESTIVSYVNRKSKKTLGQEIDFDISPEVKKITVSHFIYYRTKKEGSVCNFWFWFSIYFRTMV